MKKPVTAYSPAPPKEIPATAQDIISAGSALSALLEQEAAMMDAMLISQIGELQERKLKLTGLLERYTQYLGKHPEVMAAITPAEKKQLQETMRIFRSSMKKNYDTLLVARAVNKAVVKCVTDFVTKKANNAMYNARGKMKHGAYNLPFSVTLNQTI